MMTVNIINCVLALVFIVFSYLLIRLQFHSKEHLSESPEPHLFIPRGYTLAELAQYDGQQKPYAFISIKGVIYNASMQWYGPEGPYNAFAACDCSRHLGKFQVGKTESNADWTTLSEQHRKSLNEWEESLRAKYPPVGWIIDVEKFTEHSNNFDF